MIHSSKLPSLRLNSLEFLNQKMLLSVCNRIRDTKQKLRVILTVFKKKSVMTKTQGMSLKESYTIYTTFRYMPIGLCMSKTQRSMHIMLTIVLFTGSRNIMSLVTYLKTINTHLYIHTDRHKEEKNILFRA